MKLVRDQIRQCHSSGQQLVLRGGGGGGGGFGALMPGEELPQMAFNYGFELLREWCFHGVFNVYPKWIKMEHEATTPKVAKVQGAECLLAEMGMQLSIAN